MKTSFAGTKSQKSQLSWKKKYLTGGEFYTKSYVGNTPPNHFFMVDQCSNCFFCHTQTIGWYYFFSYGWDSNWYYCASHFCIAYFLSWQELFLKILRDSFLIKSMGSHSKRGPKPLFSRGKGAPAKFVIPKFTNQVFRWYQLLKYQWNTNQYQPKIPAWYATLVDTHLLSLRAWVDNCSKRHSFRFALLFKWCSSVIWYLLSSHTQR